jgi:hypothetical protein
MYYEPAYAELMIGGSMTWTNHGAIKPEVEFRVEVAPADVPSALMPGDPTSPRELNHIHLVPGQSYTNTFTEAGVCSPPPVRSVKEC